jgi:transcriptional regulator with XRE-family HTH domain
MESTDEKNIKRAKVKVDTHQPYGKVLEQLMERDRWTGAKLAREVGCTRNHISEILSGKCFPSFSLGQRIASVFGYELRMAKIPAIPKSPRKKKESALESQGEEAVEAVEVAPVSENGTSAKEKVKSLSELSGKVKASKKAGEE